MSPVLSPIVSEFEIEEQAASYDRWFRAKVTASLTDTRPRVPHAEAMASIRTKLAKRLETQKEAAASVVIARK